jgi:isoleucyl-tRNA synthetase
MSEEKNVYKDSLNLPKTSFDMRANLLTKEPVIQKRWQEHNLYEQIRHARKGAKRFILHDGPPFANGNIHMGTALNKVLKDMVVRTRTMAGLDAPFIPGWDCHGQPIEQKVVDNLGEKAQGMDAVQIRRRCAAYAEKFQKLQSEQFQRLGVLGEFDKPYLTMAPQYEAAVLEVFARLVEQGLVYRQLKPVHWSIANRTALADAELEYYDRQDTSIYVAFPLAGDAAKKFIPQAVGGEIHLLIWTTTPWTLPANLAVAISPEFRYAAVEAETADGAKTFVIAEARVEAVLAAVQKARPDYLKSYRTACTFSGQELLDAKLSYAHPLSPAKHCPVVAANYVTLEDGTGLVHTAPGHGMEDYGTALKAGLGIYCPVLEDGTFDDTAPIGLTGKTVWEGNPLVIDYLRAQKLLVLEEKITHSYPHDWRSKTPTIFRATEQWFIGVDRPMADGKPSLRELAMESCRREAADGGVNFVPGWGRNRIAGMLQSRPDWCISRQRSWGLPIPAFYNRKGKPLMTPASIRAVIRVIAEKGSDAWFHMSAKDLLTGYNPHADKNLPNPSEFPIDELAVGRDIVDVWFESGSSWFAVCVTRGLVDDIPVDLYLEGSDQHRGWFQLSLLPALGACGKPPFATVLTHGWVMDEQGRKMSKSLGNTVDVIEQLQKRGADILRLWTASQYYPDDVRCSENLIAQAEDAYRKIRNTLRFCMGSCFDFDAAHHSVQPAAHSIDLWMRMELHRLIRDVREAFNTYEFHKATRAIYEFCTVQASSIYLSAVKDRLYCEAPNSPRRRATQTVIHEMLIALTKMLAPILPHTCEEAWEHIPFRPAVEPHTVHLASLPDFDAEMLNLAEDIRPVNADAATWTSDKLEAGPAWIWSNLLEWRSAGLSKLETLRNAGVKNPLDVEAVFRVARGDKATEAVVKTYLSELEDLLGVGYARLDYVDSLSEGVKVDVQVFDTREKYKRCARSWKRRPDVGTAASHPELSARDAAVMKSLGK